MPHISNYLYCNQKDLSKPSGREGMYRGSRVILRVPGVPLMGKNLPVEV
jgi:hypothetical protein